MSHPSLRRHLLAGVPFVAVVSLVPVVLSWCWLLLLVLSVVYSRYLLRLHDGAARTVSLLGYLALAVAFFTVVRTVPRLGTDAMLFSQYSVDLILDGQNPYASSMHPAFEWYGVSPETYGTHTVDGDVVTSLSYPALSVLYFVPQALLGVPNLNLTSVVVLLLVLGFLLYESSPSLAFVPFLILFVNPDIFQFTSSGVFDILWVLPLLLGMRYWHQDRIAIAAIWVGLACAVKQTPWIVTPYLAVWLYAESDDVQSFVRDAGITLGAGLGAFLTPNLPFIIWNPTAWVTSVLTPVGSGPTLVTEGIGPALLVQTELLAVSKSTFTALVALVLIMSLLAYARYFNQVRWIAWIAPAFVLWFNYRSLYNYYIFFLPVAYYAILLNRDAVCRRSLRSELATALPFRNTER
jgi:uncharacterized membrane protein